MPNNQVPLLKELLQINLSGGVNERERPETADPASTLTRVENLVQDQTGAYVKRPGTTILGASTDDGGTALSKPTKLLRFNKGLGYVGSNSKLYHYQEISGKFRNKGVLPEFNVEAEFVSSSGSFSIANVRSVASCSRFHAVIITSGYTVTSLSDSTSNLTIYDRESGAVAAKYNLSLVSGDVTSLDARCAFVSDRYLHVWINAVVSTSMLGFVIDTNAVLPANEAAISPTTLDGDYGAILDIGVNNANNLSYCLYNTATPTVRSMTNAAASGTTDTIAGAIGMSVNSSKVWILTTADLMARSLTNLVTVSVAAGAHGIVGITNDGFLADDNNICWNIDSAATTFGGTTINRLALRKTAAANGTALGTAVNLDGWKVASHPFYDSVTDRVYVHGTKDSTTYVTAHAIICLSDYLTNVYAGQSHIVFRTSATLDPFVGVENAYTNFRYFPYSSKFSPLAPIQTTARGFGYAVFTLSGGHSKVSCQQFGGSSYISGGVPSIYAGDKVMESGFIDMPIVNAADSGDAGNPDGLLKYIAVYRYMNESGEVTWSRTSPTASVTVVTNKVDVLISPCAVSNRNPAATSVYNPAPVVTELYRTKSGGTQFYLCASTAGASTGLATQAISLVSGFLSVEDNLTDASLASQPLLFRQPGTAGSAVDRYPPPSGNILCQHKDRLFTTDPYGQRVYYSSFFVDGECAWYNPAFSFFIHGATGPITAIASMDGRLFVFKKDGVFVVDGDGPPEGGVSGNEYSPPQRLATEYGCVDFRSMVVTTEGIMYRSVRGIELLTRSLQVKWIGERVQDTVDANTKCCGAVLDSSGRARFALAASETFPTQNGISGCEVVFDIPANAWSVFYGSDGDGTYGRCVQDIVRADLYGYGETVVYADPATTAYGAYREDSTTGLDRGARYTPWVIETAWVKTQVQARQRINRAMLLAKKRSGANHKITISCAINYVNTYSQTIVFQPGTINVAAIEELTLLLARPEVIAARFKFEEAAPTDTGTYPIGTGVGCDVLGIAVEVASKSGPQPTASGQKG